MREHKNPVGFGSSHICYVIDLTIFLPIQFHVSCRFFCEITYVSAPIASIVVVDKESRQSQVRLFVLERYPN